MDALAVTLASAAAFAGGCTADATKSLVREFVADYGDGRVALIDRMWAPAPRFKWYSTGPPGKRLGSVSRRRETLAAYLRMRVRRHERIQLTKLGAGYDSQRRIVNFGGKLVRSADDLHPTQHDFKGAADCVSREPRLIVWSM